MGRDGSPWCRDNTGGGVFRDHTGGMTGAATGSMANTGGGTGRDGLTRREKQPAMGPGPGTIPEGACPGSTPEGA